MVFSEPIFMFMFLPVTLLIYYAVPFRFKNAVLFFSGLLFYSWGEPVYVLIMVLSTLIDYIAGRVMDKCDANPTVRKSALIVSVVMNLTLLGIFKYSGLVVDSFNSVFNLSLRNPNLPLPVGISFFTFQSMSYTIDLYRKNISVQKSFVDFAAFVTMFPQIVAGPIVRYEDVSRELEIRKIDIDAISKGISVFICGLCKKVLIANSVGELWTTVKETDYYDLPATTAWLGIIAFTLQIYFDFSGYSDMAIGLGKMLGFNFPQNFDYPYNSKTVSEFWRRWHMTLGGWFKSYVYFPLGGSRNGKAKTIRNLLIVWFLTGLWHGASWNFVIWGVYYGILLILEKFVFASVIKNLPSIVTRIYTILAVIIGWVIF
ncbi:MAG: MBOAT family protein, partial [Clostridia bacterium]|nr:MBOAT family protein [Clostridia bacterium]